MNKPSLYIRVFIMLATLIMLPVSVRALTVNVNTTVDSVDAQVGNGVCANLIGACSLRAAIMETNSSGTASIINVPAGIYTLTIPSSSLDDFDPAFGDMDIGSGGLIIKGAGSGKTIIDASAINHRAFDIPINQFLFPIGSVTFDGLTIRGGNTSGLGAFNRGAAINAGSRLPAAVTLNNVEITGNNGASAVFSNANLTITNSTISGNTGDGVFLTNDAVTLTKLKVLTVTKSTIDNNTGSGIHIGNALSGSIDNSTISSNGIDGIIAQFTQNQLVLTNTTVANNNRNGIAGIGFTIFDPAFGPFFVKPNIQVRNSIISGNTGGDIRTPAVDGNAVLPISQGFNIVGDNTGVTAFTVVSDMNNTDPLLQPLGLNAPGTTRTHAISAASSALDAASALFAPATDQRGIARPQGAADDIGAYEFMPTSSDLSITKTDGLANITAGNPLTYTIVVSNAGPDAVTGATVTDTLPASLSGATWSCVGTGGATCTANGAGSIGDTVNIPIAGTLTYTLNASLISAATGTLTNTATVTFPAGTSDPNTANNSATDNTTIISVPNQPPVPTATPNPVIATEDTPASIQVAHNDPDLGDTHTYAVTLAATNGVATVNATGLTTYTPHLNFNGTDSFVVTVADAAGATGTVTINVTVNAVNDAPTATSAAITTAEDTASAGATPAVTDVDIATNGDSHIFTILTQPTNGTAAVVGNKLVYTPKANFNGMDVFTYSATDTGGLSVNGTANVTVTAVNDAPTVTSAAITTAEDTTSTGVTPGVSDVDIASNGDTHTFTILTQPANGAANIVGNQLVYTPSLNYNGSDAFTFRATDTGGLFVDGMANVTVNAVNDAPAPTAPAIATKQGIAATSQVSPNDPDAGDTHSYAVITAAANGVATIDSTGLATYAPKPGFTGNDSFVVTVTDAAGATGMVTINATVIAAGSVTNDFNGDGKSDILFRDTAPTGRTLMKLMNGRALISQAFVSSLPASWPLVGTGDFNGDGKSDTLYRQASTGRLLMKLMNGHTLISHRFVSSLPATWAFAGTGDFNGDGKSDMLFREISTGRTLMKLMNGFTLISQGFVSSMPPTWPIVGTGDFNGDGKADILFRQASTGRLLMKLMNGFSLISHRFVSSMPATWTFAGTGDFNGDGKSDMLFRQVSTGHLLMKLMSGFTLISHRFVSSLPASWPFAGTGDFNGDGKSDMLFRHPTNGRTLMKLMNGFTLVSQGFVSSMPASWNIVNTR